MTLPVKRQTLVGLPGRMGISAGAAVSSSSTSGSRSGSAGAAAKAREAMLESGRRERKRRRLVMGAVAEGGSGGRLETGRKGIAGSEGTASEKRRYGVPVLVTD